MADIFPSEKYEELFNYIFEQYYTYVCKICYNRIGKDDCLEDIVQEVFLCIARNIEMLRTDICPKPWIAAIARNCSSSYLAKKSAYAQREIHIEEEGIDQILESHEDEPLRIVVDAEAVQIIYDEIHRLEAKYADVLMLKSKYGYSIDQISKLLNINKNTVYTRYKKGRLLIKKALIKEAERGGKIER